MINNIACRNGLLTLQLLAASVVTPRPHIVRRTYIRCSSQVSKQPNGWPQTSHIVFTRQFCSYLYNATSKTKLIPSLYHTRLIVFCYFFWIQSFFVWCCKRDVFYNCSYIQISIARVH